MISAKCTTTAPSAAALGSYVYGSMKREYSMPQHRLVTNALDKNGAVDYTDSLFLALVGYE